MFVVLNQTPPHQLSQHGGDILVSLILIPLSPIVRTQQRRGHMVATWGSVEGGVYWCRPRSPSGC